jgi:hypothetical protein
MTPRSTRIAATVAVKDFESEAMSKTVLASTRSGDPRLRTP